MRAASYSGRWISPFDLTLRNDVDLRLDTLRGLWLFRRSLREERGAAYPKPYQQPQTELEAHHGRFSLQLLSKKRLGARNVLFVANEALVLGRLTPQSGDLRGEAANLMHLGCASS